MGLNVKKIREDFPTLNIKIRGKPIIYFDNACSTLKPKQVINAVNGYYYDHPGCHGRTNHLFGRETTEKYNLTRKKIQRYIHAKKQEEIIFTKNTTEAINLISNSLNFEKGDAILTSDIEHNSNLLPWQVLRKKKQVKHQIIETKEDTTFDLDSFQNLINKNVKLVAITQTSNITGVTNPVKEICKIAHENNALVLVDGAQAIPHKSVDVTKLNVDFYVFSSHKMLGPTGVGCMYGKLDLLKEIPQFLVGGETVKNSSYTSYEVADIPDRFEAGIQNYAGVIGLGAAIDYLNKVGLNNIEKHESNLNKVATDILINNDHITILGPIKPELRGGILNITIKNKNAHEIARILDSTSNIMVRAGKQCVHSWFNKNKIEDSIRASFYIYNTKEEVEMFCETLSKLNKFF